MSVIFLRGRISEVVVKCCTHEANMRERFNAPEIDRSNSTKIRSRGFWTFSVDKMLQDVGVAEQPVASLEYLFSRERKGVCRGVYC